MCTGHSPACLHLIPLFAGQSSQATAVAHARADAVVPAASKAFSPDSSAARSSPGYLLNSANCRDPVLIYRVATHGQPSGKVKPRDSHLTAVHSLADVLELNPVLASTAAAIQLPTRTKVRALARALTATHLTLLFLGNASRNRTFTAAFQPPHELRAGHQQHVPQQLTASAQPIVGCGAHTPCVTLLRSGA